MKVFVIVPTHNKEHLIEQVYDGIASNISKELDYKIIFIIDGCTDNTEKILNDYTNKHNLQDNTVLLHTPDLHEIRSLNTGLRYVESELNPSPDDLVFTVQDDCVIQEPKFDLYFKKLNEKHKNLGRISWRLGLSLHTDGTTLLEKDFVESEFGHWAVESRREKDTGEPRRFTPPAYKEIKHRQFAITEAVIRSPTCVLWKRYKEVGFYCEDLVPFGNDCHEMSIRKNKAGYRNGILALKYESDIDWGSTREKGKTEYNSKLGEIYDRNRKRVLQIHKDYFKL